MRWERGWLLCACALVASPVGAEITGPAKIGTGQLVVLRCETEAQWIAIEPVDLTYEQFESGKALAFSSGCKSGRVIVLCVAWDTRRIDRHILTIEGDGPAPGPEPQPTDVWADFVAALSAARAAIPEPTRGKLGQVAQNYQGELAAIMALPEASFNRALSAERLRSANAAIMSEPDRIAARPFYDALVKFGTQYDAAARTRDGYGKWLKTVVQGLGLGR